MVESSTLVRFILIDWLIDRPTGSGRSSRSIHTMTELLQYYDDHISIGCVSVVYQYGRHATDHYISRVPSRREFRQFLTNDQKDMFQNFPIFLHFFNFELVNLCIVCEKHANLSFLQKSVITTCKIILCRCPSVVHQCGWADVKTSRSPVWVSRC